MAAVIQGKYQLKSIHEEIGLFDRKLAHVMNFEKFETEAERVEAARKLTLKRETLVQAAVRLAAEGVEFKPSDLPRSMRGPGETETVAPAIAESVAVAKQPVVVPSAARKSSGPYAGTSLDWQASVRQYMMKKGRA